jgi:hypothetical protein
LNTIASFAAIKPLTASITVFTASGVAAIPPATPEVEFVESDNCTCPDIVLEPIISICEIGAYLEAKLVPFS